MSSCTEYASIRHWISELLPEPATPATTVSTPRGKSTEMCLRLCSEASSTLKKDLGSSGAGLKSEPHVHDVVRDTDHLLVVLDEQDRVAVVTELADRVLEQGYVVVVQADAGLVEDVEQVGEGRVDVLGYLASLGLAAGERTHRTV